MSLVARHLEAAGLPTVCLASALDIVRAGRPPRAVFVDYPLGHTAGKPFDLDDQRAVVNAALEQLEAIEAPGTIVQLAQAWSDAPGWRSEAMRPDSGDQRAVRDETPRYQCEADRRLAEAAASG